MKRRTNDRLGGATDRICGEMFGGSRNLGGVQVDSSVNEQSDSEPSDNQASDNEASDRRLPDPIVPDAAERPGLGLAVCAGLCAAVGYFLTIFLVFGIWVHYYYAGVYSGPLMISTFFGVSEKSVQAGAHPIYEAPVAGWDGQFYYTQSNDPWLLDDYSGNTLFDSVSYRYQRNALSILAYLAGKGTGQELTTPLTFFLTQLVIMRVGFGVLVAFLIRAQVHWGWSMVWGFYGGLLRPFIHGLPDPTADTLLLLSIVAVLNKRLFLYALTSSLLCLCRESYAAPAAALWALTLFGKVPWNEKTHRLTKVVLTTVPGVVVLAWAYYVAHRTGTEMLSGSRSIPWGGLVDFPFKAYFSCLWIDIKASNENDAIYATSCAFCLSVVLYIVVKRARHSMLSLAILPHVLLMTMTGWIVWEAGVGFFKNTSSVVLLGVLLLGVAPSRWLKGALIFTFLASVHYIYRADYRHQGFLPPLTAASSAPVDPMPSTVVPIEEPIQYASHVEFVSEEAIDAPYSGFFSWCHRFPRNCTVRVTNTSTQTWHASIPGDKAIAIGRRYMRGEDVLHEDRLVLYKSVLPGESLDFTFTIPTRAGKRGDSAVRIGVVQDGNAWFYWHEPDQKLDIPF